MSEKIEEFVSEISKCISDKTFLKLSFHKPKQGLLKKTNIEVFVDNEGFEKLKISNFSATQDFTEIKTISELSAVINAYSSKYDFIDLYATSYDLFLKKSKKGVIAIIKNPKKNITPVQVNFGVHNKSKDYFIDASVGYLVDLGICDLNGKVKPSMYHKFRQINRFIEIISHHVVLKSGEPTIVDMGSGKGYLTFALHTYYSEILQQSPKIVGYELREDLVKLCEDITKKHHLSGLHFEPATFWM
jgi:Methyltransferase domain